MLGKLIVKTGNFLCLHRKGWLVSKINRAISVLYFKIENDNYALDSNGEGRVLKLLSRFNFSVVIDVGANHGEWSLAAIMSQPRTKIFALEASPITFKILQNNLSTRSEIKIQNLGLYDKKGSLDFMQNEDDGLSSLIPSTRNANSRVIKVEVVTLDEFVRQESIDHINFLKIDTEGADYSILQGAQSLLQAGKIDVIQFEYGFVSVDTKNLLKDHYALLEHYGYVLGKIYPSGVQFMEYDRAMENFIGPNFLAVRKDLNEIIEALR